MILHDGALWHWTHLWPGRVEMRSWLLVMSPCCVSLRVWTWWPPPCRPSRRPANLLRSRSGHNWQRSGSGPPLTPTPTISRLLTPQSQLGLVTDSVSETINKSVLSTMHKTNINSKNATFFYVVITISCRWGLLDVGHGTRPPRPHIWAGPGRCSVSKELLSRDFSGSGRQHHFMTPGTLPN